MRSHYTLIRHICLSILDDPAEADDAAQETFIAAHRSLENFRGEASLKTWLTAISVNVCRGILRKRKRQESLIRAMGAFQSLIKRTASIDETMMHDESESQLWQAVDRLDDKHRLPLVLYYVHELGVPEIAAILNTNPGTIHSRLHYARKQIAASMRAAER